MAQLKKQRIFSCISICSLCLVLQLLKTRRLLLCNNYICLRCATLRFPSTFALLSTAWIEVSGESAAFCGVQRWSDKKAAHVFSRPTARRFTRCSDEDEQQRRTEMEKYILAPSSSLFHHFKLNSGQLSLHAPHLLPSVFLLPDITAPLLRTWVLLTEWVGGGSRRNRLRQVRGQEHPRDLQHHRFDTSK